MKAHFMRWIFWVGWLALGLNSCQSAEPTELTTIVLVRHAEEVQERNNPNTELTEEGLERAQALALALKDQRIAGIYVHDTPKSRQTAEPLAISHSVQPTLFEGNGLALAEQILQFYAGKTVVVVGNAEDIPQLVNQFLGDAQYEVIPKYKYDTLFIVSALKKGRVSIVSLRYGG